MPRGNRLRLLAGLALLAGLVVLAYSNSFSAGWHFDDTLNITENPYFQHVSLTPASLFHAMVQNRKQNRPFSNLTLALNYYFNRTDIRGYHLVNLALHLLAGLTAFLVLRRTFRLAGLPEARRDFAALLVAAAWAVHPIQTQAVTYVVQRHAVMASALMLCTLAAYLHGRETREPRQKYLWYGLAIMAWIGAAGSKEIALVTPGLVLLYEFYFFQKFSVGFVRRHRNVVAAGLILLVSALVFILSSPLWSKLMAGYRDYPFTLGQRLLTEPRALFQYLGLILWPRLARFSLEHDPAISTSLFHPWTTLPAILAWLALLAAAIRYARKYPLPSFALFWYLGNLFLESSFLPLDLMFEHRLYLPSLAVIALLLAPPVLYLPRLRGAGVALALIMGMLVLGTVSRNRVWRTEYSLWRDCVRKAPLKARPWLGLGKGYWLNGNNDRALTAYSKAIEKKPDYAEAYYSRACIYYQRGQLEPARNEYSKSLELNPAQPQALNSRGAIYKTQGRFELAFQDFNQALELDPNLADAYINRGNAYELTGRFDQALGDYSRGLDLKPGAAEGYGGRGQVYLKQGRPDRAIADFDRALALNPKYLRAWVNRGNAYQQLGQQDPAIASYSHALELNPNTAEAYFRRGRAYQAQGKRDLAEADLARARELDPRLFDQP
jgi:protein O-mannosyl-transferase